MNKKKTILLFLFFSFNIAKVFATADYLIVNHITKQLYVAETTYSHGWIGWKTISENELETHVKKGYQFTNNSFLLEQIILLIAFVVIGYVIFKRLMKKNTKTKFLNIII